MFGAAPLSLGKIFINVLYLISLGLVIALSVSLALANLMDDIELFISGVCSIFLDVLSLFVLFLLLFMIIMGLDEGFEASGGVGTPGLFSETKLNVNSLSDLF